MSTEFGSLVENRHEAVKDWKEKNKKQAVGYLCCVVPEALIYAAGALPVKICGSGEKFEAVDEHMVPYGCGFVQSCFDLAVRGIYDYLDTVIVPNTCDLVARMEYWYRVAAPKASTMMGSSSITTLKPICSSSALIMPMFLAIPPTKITSFLRPTLNRRG